MGRITLLRLVPVLLQAAAAAESEYAPAQTCAGCHAGIWETYRRTGMGRSFSLPTAENTLANWTGRPYYFALTFRRLGSEGLGPGRIPAELETITDLATGRSVYAGGRLADGELPGIGLALATPTRLKAGGAWVRRPEFAVLFRIDGGRAQRSQAHRFEQPMKFRRIPTSAGLFLTENSLAVFSAATGAAVLQAVVGASTHGLR